MHGFSVCMNQCAFLLPKISQKFDLKNMILTDTKDCSWEKWSKFAKFRKDKSSNRQIFTISSR
jgi:hypothetical protein